MTVRACPSVEDFVKQAAVLGWKVFDEQAGRPMNLNIVGWRNRLGQENRFEDFIALYWKEGGQWISRFWPATTRPGKEYLLNPINQKGTAILMPGQYIRSFRYGKFKGKEALLQNKPVSVVRDNNRDEAWDESGDCKEVGNFGIHIHRAGWFNKLIGGSSAGCQVFQRTDHFEQFMKLCKLSTMWWDQTFTYNLLAF